jgi:hypothetical protein
MTRTESLHLGADRPEQAILNCRLRRFGSYLWTYEYDVWGNLTRANSACAGTYEAGYDALGRRVWQKVMIPNVSTTETYFLYDGDTLIAEVGLVNNQWQLIAESVWGPPPRSTDWKSVCIV